MYFIVRNGRQFGPFDMNTLVDMVQNGKVLMQDAVIDDSYSYSIGNGESNECVRDLFKRNRMSVSVKNHVNPFKNFKTLFSSVIFNSKIFNKQEIKADQRLLLLGMVGLIPMVTMYVNIANFISFYAISLYFASIWGLFFYYMFKTKQVDRKTTIRIFFLVQAMMLVFWNLTGLVRLNFFYSFVNSSDFFMNLLGYVFGVGFTEELVKALPLYFIARNAKTPYVPQTMVFYGLICGISFGVFEGVEYQLGVNSKYEYGQAFLLNIARLTTLPFFHAMCTGMAGYFIAFAFLRPLYRRMLLLLAIAEPALIHGLYDTFSSTCYAPFIAILIVLLLNFYLRNDSNVHSMLKD